MKKIVKYIPIVILGLMISSCLKSGLEELPAFDDADITNFRFEYRWIEKANDNDQLNVIQLNRSFAADTTSNTITCEITVPAANDDFPESVRNTVALSEIVGYADISTAATMSPVGNAPVLGELADFSQSAMQYEVVAADGKTKKVWTLNITGFNK